jgi:predicted amidohydrolase YtcJ
VAVEADRIVAVGSDADALALRGPRTEVVDLAGRLLLPGFIDAHTHFGNAAEWCFGVGLYEATDPDQIVAAVAAAAGRIPKGLWLTGGDYGAAVTLDRRTFDHAVPDHPVLLRRADGAHFANGLALARARFGAEMPDPYGGRMERQAGELTGVLFGRAGERVAELIPPRNLEQRIVGARLALEDLARVGITSIHDVARLDDLSQRHLFHTDVERSATDLAIFRELQARRELTARVYAFLSLPLWREVVAAGIRPGSEEGLIRFGALKSFIDGFFMDAPYADDPDFAGDFSFRFVDEATMAADIAGADRAGFDPVVHTVGDKAHRLLLDWYEAAIAANPKRDRRLRVIHAWYPSAREIARIGTLGLIVDITPQHMVNDVARADTHLGPERTKTAHAWRALADAGARLSLVSDWPGSFNERRLVPLAPIENIALAVNRTWHPEQRLTVPDAIAAYTTGPAYASYEEGTKGSISTGKLADLVVLSADILSLPPEKIRETEVDLTVFGGRAIYRR